MIFRALTCVVCLALCTGLACAYPYTLTYDDIAVGNDLSFYGDQYGAVFTIDWRIVDGTELGWGLPHSGTNVAMWIGPYEHGAGLRFGNREEDIPADRYRIRSLGAYFNTEMHAVIRMVGYDRTTWTPVVSAIIGGSGESWQNRYVEIASEAGNIDWVMFEGGSDRSRFSVDDMTIIPVPEPSSLLALGVGAVGLLGLRLSRRRMNH